MATYTRVDQTAVKAGQLMTAVLLVTAFILDSRVPVTLAIIAQLLGSLDAPFAPYRLIYQHILKPAGLVKPNLQPDHPEPHRFAQLVGALFNMAGILALWAGAPVLGWALIWVVIVLANLNAWVGFCMGCWCYYQLHRLGVPGFTQAPLR